MNKAVATELPAHVLLNQPSTDPRERPGVPGQSLRLNGKLHDFSALIPLYGASFTERLLDAFARKYVHDTASTTEKRCGNLRKFLLYLAGFAAEASNQNTAAAQTYRALVENQPESITSTQWIDTVDVFVSRLRDLTDHSVVRSSNPLTRQNIIESLSIPLQHLAQEGLWPDIGALRGLSGSRVSRGANIPSLGELQSSTEASETNSKNAATYGAVNERNRERLLRLRSLCEDALLEEEAAFDRRLKLLAAPGQPSLREIRAAIPLIPSSYARSDRDPVLHPKVQTCFPLDDDDRRLGSLLRYIISDHEGVFRLQELDYPLQLVVSRCGGTARVMSHLEGGGRALLAAYTLVLIDTGINIQPCDDLAADPFVGKARYGKIQLRQIGSVKSRARYKAVTGNIIEITPGEEDESNDEILEVPTIVPNSRISSAKAIEVWLKLSEPHRERARRAGNSDANYLWIVRNGHYPKEVRRYLEHAWKRWWTEFLEEHAKDPVIGGLPIQRRMIRTTVLQLRDAHHGGDAEVVALLSGQSGGRAASRHYLNRAHIQRMLDERIREFQNLFEASVAGDSPDRPAQLELSPDEFHERRTRAVETGLGLTCLDPTAGVQPGTKDSICTRLDACSTCPLLRFIPTQQSIEALTLFHDSLKHAEEEFIAKNPERWIRVWLPALALCTALLNLLMSGPKQVLVQQSVEAVKNGLDQGSLVLFRPW
ncbi:hypothetical protein ACD578_16415 [Microvirga sp. RSM25]|uniref:hypothetical protein n=1 Tax=Microvirga sp. RSM25 TaxID=3273802 RepID=UPI00384D2129